VVFYRHPCRDLSGSAADVHRPLDRSAAPCWNMAYWSGNTGVWCAGVGFWGKRRRRSGLAKAPELGPVADTLTLYEAVKKMHAYADRQVRTVRYRGRRR